MNFFKYLTITLPVLVFSTVALGQTPPTQFTFGAGNLCEYIHKFQTDEKGSKNICSFNPVVTVGLEQKIAPSFSLWPQIGMSFPRSGADKNIKKLSMYALFNVRYDHSLFNLFSGLGLFSTRMWGPGGSQVLDNGSGTDSFPMPKKAVYSNNIILNFGAGHRFTEEWSTEIYTYLFNPLSSDDRAVSLGLTVTYLFKETK